MVDLALVTDFPGMKSATSWVVKIIKDLLQCPRTITVMFEQISRGGYSAMRDMFSENVSSHGGNIRFPAAAATKTPMTGQLLQFCVSVFHGNDPEFGYTTPLEQQGAGFR